MLNHNKIELPKNVQAALDLLKERRSKVVMTSEVRPEDTGEGYCFEVKLEPVEINGERIDIEVKVSLDSEYPISEVNVYLKQPNIQGEKHQRLSDGKLCLNPALREMFGDEKIIDTLDNAREWVVDALNSRLALETDSYEEPDFDHGKATIAQSSIRLVYRADEQLYNEVWRRRVGTCGDGVLRQMSSINVYAFVEASDNSGSIVFKDADWSCIKVPGRNNISVIWCFVDDIIEEFHRPPTTWVELLRLLDSCTGAKELIRKMWSSSDSNVGYVLVGWPVPDIYGGDCVTCLWRAVAFQTFKGYKANHKKENLKKFKPRLVWGKSELASCNPVKWLKAENVSYRNLSARWRLQEALANATVAIVGCGAVGSALADKLARGGIGKLFLVDPDCVEYGNLSRHVLQDSSIGKSKSQELGKHINGVSPFMKVESAIERLPHLGEAKPKILSCDLIFDCTGDASANKLLSNLLKSSSKRLVRLFLNSNATYLTGVISGRNVSCWEVEKEFCRDLEMQKDLVKGQGLSIAEYQERAAAVRTSGCWSPTYPGSWIDIEAMVGCFVKKIESEVQRGWKCDGRVVVFKCLNPSFIGPSVECVWDQRYR